jgi:acyl-CoA reductase-like NAD-dependent aldehyde dehydrogenase
MTRVDEIVGKAVKANQKWSLIPIHKRQEMMLLLADKMTCNLQELAELESRGGKPITQAKEDIIASIDVFRYFAQLKVEFTKSYEIGKTIRQPIGTVGLITSFNYPCCNYY